MTDLQDMKAGDRAENKESVYSKVQEDLQSCIERIKKLEKEKNLFHLKLKKRDFDRDIFRRKNE